MSGINSFLADLYGNPGLEKTAGLTQDDLVVWDAFTKLAAADGIDVDELDDGQVDALYDHYSNGDADGDADGDVEFPPNWDQDDVNHFASMDEDGREQFAQFKEAEFLGEVIAHSQFSTLRKLAEAEMEKEAMSLNPMPGLRSAGGYIAGKAKALDAGAQGLGRRMHGAADDLAAARASRRETKLLGRHGKLTKKYQEAGGELSGRKKNRLNNLILKAEKANQRSTEAPRELGNLGARALGYGVPAAGAIGGVGGIGGAGYALGSRKREKKAYAIEAAAEQRALQFLKMAGIDVDDEDDEDVVNERAAEMLIDSGYGELLE